MLVKTSSRLANSYWTRSQSIYGVQICHIIFTSLRLVLNNFLKIKGDESLIKLIRRVQQQQYQISSSRSQDNKKEIVFIDYKEYTRQQLQMQQVWMQQNERNSRIFQYNQSGLDVLSNNRCRGKIAREQPSSQLTHFLKKLGFRIIGVPIIARLLQCE